VLSAAADNLTDNATWHFRFGPKATQDGIAVADAVVELGYKRIAVINNSTPFGNDGARSVIKALEAKGIKVETQQVYDAAATDVAPQIINLRQANPDVILAYPYPADGARVARTVRQLGIKAPIIMPRVGAMAAFLKLAAENADGILVPNSVDLSRPEVAKLYEDYNAKFKPIQPSPSPAQGHDAMTLAITVLSDADVQKAINGGNLAEARKAIRDATYKHGKFEGMQGQKGTVYQFAPGNHHGAPDSKFFVMIEVADKGTKLIQPDMAKLKVKN
jgi:branched-chain amino acid transport system substrate-binding protein